MSVTRINEFQARDGKSDGLRDLIASFLPRIRQSDGNISCSVLQSQDDPHRFMVVEVWESIEAHKLSVKSIPPGLMMKGMALLAAVPKGEYFSEP